MTPLDWWMLACGSIIGAGIAAPLTAAICEARDRSREQKLTVRCAKLDTLLTRWMAREARLRAAARFAFDQWSKSLDVAGAMQRLARLVNAEPPEEGLPIMLFCPRCGMLHVDAPEPEKGWTNPPHCSHLCARCGFIWRPADYETNGVASIRTRGKNDSWPPPLAGRDDRSPDRRVVDLVAAMWMPGYGWNLTNSEAFGRLYHALAQARPDQKMTRERHAVALRELLDGAGDELVEQLQHENRAALQIINGVDLPEEKSELAKRARELHACYVNACAAGLRWEERAKLAEKINEETADFQRTIVRILDRRGAPRDGGCIEARVEAAMIAWQHAREVLEAPDAAGRPFAQLLRECVEYLRQKGDGPMADCLAEKADRLEAL